MNATPTSLGEEQPGDVAAELSARLDRALEDPEARSAQAGLEERIAIAVGDASIGLVPEGDGYHVIRPAPGMASLRLSADAETWKGALAAVPRPGLHSITAMRRCGRLQVEGDPAALARSLHLLERLLELLREPTAPHLARPVARDLGQIVGHYHELQLPDGSAVTVYAEHAGSGIPVVFLHTAGADSRQFQALLADVQLGQRCRLWAFDLPFHGRSMPPESWNGRPVPLTQRAYAASCAAFLHQVVGSPAVVVGCSMGAAMALVMAALHPDLVRGVLAIEAPYQARGRLNPYLAHAAVNSASHNPSYVRGLMSPLAAEPARRRAAWIYSQGALGVYAGDLAFYEEFDGAAIAPRIDATKTPVALLAGVYDYSATPEDAQRLAALIPGASLEIMPELGHFPMLEHPDLFRTYFARALERLIKPGPGAIG